MRNLRNVSRSAVHFNNETALPLTATTWDTSSNTLICAFGPSESHATVELRRTGEDGISSKSIASWDAQCPHPELACDKILNLHYFADTSIACLVLAGGDIVIVRESPLPGEELLEIVGSVDAGIVGAAWSPDEELLVVVTNAETVLFMSREFEGFADVKFGRDDPKLSKHVNVGWGKKETQFKGKRARAMRDPTMPENVDAGALSKHDDGSVRVTWRGDGAYVAVNTIEERARRLMRVYSRDGALDSVSEPVDGFEGPLSWRPSGNIIAGIRRSEEDVEVIFFERNGLRHGEFSLRLSAAEREDWGTVQDLTWNVDSTVLAVSFSDRVQLWTMGNYHYYLKQQIRIPQSYTIKGLSWHPEQPLCVAIHGNEQAILLEYASTVAKSSTSPPNDFGTIAVIDGKTVKLTPLCLANIPPPMCLHEVHLDDVAIDAVIDTERSLLVVLTATGLSIFDYPFSLKAAEREPTLKSVLPWEEHFGTSYQLALMGGTYAVLSYEAENHQIYLAQYSSGGHRTGIEIGTGQISTISTGIDNIALCIQTKDGAILTCHSGQDFPSPRTVTRLPKPCPWIEHATVAGEDIVFGLTSSGNLFANHRLLVVNCTSFVVTPAHLIFTTTHHLLQFMHLTSVEDLEVPPNEPETDERCRSIERGAKLVTVIPSACSVVLQMPRGNLETIYPRALVLAGIRKSIEDKKYKKAFLVCRSHRVDMNILHDHAPEQFMLNVALFVDQITKVEHLDLFLSQLRDEDVSKTMYKETNQKRRATHLLNCDTVGNPEQNDTQLTTMSKVNRICDAMLEVLQSRTASNLQNIITANVCKSPPDLVGGLSVVSSLRSQSEEVAEKSAEHICFLADVNQLYDTALGMYDLELALLVAQQSQKDPKEYIPYMQSLQEQDSVRRQFTIDNDLGRYGKAIRHLHDLDSFEELKTYAEKHELYSTAIELYKYNTDRLNKLMKLYADYLYNQNRFMEAGIAYEFLQDYTAAVPAYRQALKWQEALSCATQAPVSESELQELAQSLAEGLVESKEYQNAATIYLEYLSDIVEAARNLCKAYLFAEAMRIVSLRRKYELLDTVVDAGLVEGFTSTTELLADCKAQITAQIPRLRELRVKKERDPLAFYTGDAIAGEGPDIPDNVSLAPTDASTSGGTFMTRYTGHTNGTLNTQTTRKTSKNRRREERKRARGKKGSVYEEEYLVNSIGRLIERVNSTGEEVARLVEGLVRRGMRERAVAVENAMTDIVGMCEAVLPEVFSEKEENDKPTGEEEAVTTKGADAVFLDMVEGGGKIPTPMVKKFEKLALIA